MFEGEKKKSEKQRRKKSVDVRRMKETWLCNYSNNKSLMSVASSSDYIDGADSSERFIGDPSEREKIERKV